MKKNKLDEMQEQTLLRIEHNCCCLAFWGLAASITIQGILGCYLDHIWGEILCLFLISGYMIVSCLKQGIWDRKLVPSRRNNLLCSLAASIFIGIFAYFQLEGKLEQQEKILPVCIGFMVFVFLLSMAVLSICTLIYQKRKDSLEGE